MIDLSSEEQTALCETTATPNQRFCEYLTDLFIDLDHVPEFPIKILWELENRCQIDCQHCWADTNGDVETPSRDQLLETADEIVAEGAEVVSFSGGEVLLSPHLKPLVTRLKNGGIHIEILTNGELIADNIGWLADRLDEGDEVQVSIDGPPEVHETQRRGSSFDRLEEGVELLQDVGIPVRANFTATPITLESLPEVIDRCDRNGIEPLSVVPIYPRGDGIELWERFSPAAYLKTVAACSVDVPIDFDVYLPIEAFELLDCLEPEQPANGEGVDANDSTVHLPDGRTHLQIQADGSIYPGSDFVDPQYQNGTIADRTVAEAWTDDRWDGLREGRRLAGTKCEDCAYRPRCAGGPTARVRQFYGDIHHADPFCDHRPD